MGYVAFILSGLFFSLLFPMVGGVIIAPIIGTVIRPSMNVAATIITPAVCGAFGGLGFWVAALIVNNYFDLENYILLAVAVAISLIIVNQHVQNRAVILCTQIFVTCALFIFGL